jgi:2-keto-4-pentenoate hydratase/2-oxohepta-3-ene-1,7-dioic acid hydratase in catechol pathway
LAYSALGNDLSSRDSTGREPLYLTQARVFAGSCSLGKEVVAADGVDPHARTPHVAGLQAGVVVPDQSGTRYQHRPGAIRLSRRR